MTKYDLQHLNTFGLAASCNALLQFSHVADLTQWLQAPENDKEKLLILGGGSNLLLSGHIDKTFIQPMMQEVEYQETDESVLLTAGAGVNWHQLVLDSLDKGYSGLENLSLIPGNIGAAPIQNIGAYGVELKDRFVSLEALEIKTGMKRNFNKEQCEFAYRDSVFKGHLKGRYIITSVTLKLDLTPQLVLNYGPLRNLLADKTIEQITAKQVSEQVIKIRSSKLPDPNELGNAGSFFKNPIVEKQNYQKLIEKHPKLVAYPLADGRYKLAAGWLIDQAGLKGYRLKDAGVHKEQALVLVNYGTATSDEMLQLAGMVRDKIWQQFAVELVPEVWIIGEQDVFPKQKIVSHD